MTERHYVKLFFTNYAKYWLMALVAGLAIGFAVSYFLKPTYAGSVSFTLTKKQPLNQATTPFYLYDGYYGEQAAVQVRNDLALWLISPKTIYDVYNQAGIALPNKAPAALSQLFQVSNSNNNNMANVVDLTYKAKSQSDGQKLGRSLVEYTQSNYPAGNVTISPSDPLVLTVAPSRALITIGVGLSLALLAFLITLVIHYFREETK